MWYSFFSQIDYAAGIILSKKTGDKVQKGDVLATLYADDEGLFKASAARFLEAITIGDNKKERNPLVYALVSKNGVTRYDK